MRRRLPKVNRFSKHQPGIIMIMSFAFLLVVMILSVAFLSKTQNFLRFESRSIEQEMAIHIAEAGIDYAAYQLKINGNWQGVSSFALGEGEFEVSVGPKVINNKTVQVAAYVPSKASPRAKRFISMDFEPSEILYNNWPEALATLNGDIPLTANVIDETGGNKANIWSSNSITAFAPRTVNGSCKYDGPGGTVSGNVTCTGSPTIEDAGDHSLLNYNSAYKGCDSFYKYWEITATGVNNDSSPTDCEALTSPSISRTIDCFLPNGPNLGGYNYTDPVSGNGICELYAPQEIPSGDPQWGCTGTGTGPYDCYLGNRKFIGAVKLSGAAYKWHMTGTVYVTGDFSLKAGAVMKISQSINGYGTVVLAENKMDINNTILPGALVPCVERTVGVGENYYLWFITKSADFGSAFTIGCHMVGVISVPNGGLTFSNSGSNSPRLHGAAIAREINPLGGAFEEIKYDFYLADGTPFGSIPATQAAYIPKKGTFSLIKETNFTSSLVGWWKFDGNTSDASAMGNNGTANGGTTYENGKFGQAIKFRGEPNNDYVEVPDSNSLDFQSTMSITAWFKKESPFNAEAFLVQKGQYSGGSAVTSYELGFPTGFNDHIVFKVRSGPFWISSPSSLTAVSDNSWHFAAGTFDGTNLCVWLDANKRCATYSGVTINITSRPLTIGAASTFTVGDPTGVLNGQIDNVKIYKTGLTDAEVARDRDNGP